MERLIVKKIMLFSDSQSAVGILTLGWVNTSHRSVILEIKQTMDILKTQNIKVELNWTPGHAEIAGNEIADTVQPSTCFYQSRRVVVCSGAWKRLNSTQFPRYSHADHTIFSRRIAPPPRRLAPTPRSVGIFRAYLDAARLLPDD